VIRLTIWLLPLAWMAMIIWFSGNTFRDEATASVVRPLLQALFPWASVGTIEAVHWLIRKSAHVTEYAVLTTLWFVPLSRNQRRSRRGSALVAFLIAIGWAVVDELYQAASVTRTGSARDVGIDATGALVASFFTGFGWRHAAACLTTALLWMAAAGGTAIIAVNLTTGVPSGILWLTVPMATAVIVWRWRRNRPSDPRRV
jgi:VanZ family protein